MSIHRPPHSNPRLHQHALPQQRQPAGAGKGQHLKALLGQHALERGAGEKLDVATVPQHGKVPVKLAGQRQRQVLQVTVIGRGHDQLPPPRPPPECDGQNRESRAGHKDARSPRC